MLMGRAARPWALRLHRVAMRSGRRRLVLLAERQGAAAGGEDGPGRQVQPVDVPMQSPCRVGFVSHLL